MIAKIFDVVFGCRHSQYSFPMTVRRGSRRSLLPSIMGTYVVCLDCGREMAYDWQRMKVLNSANKSKGPVAA